MMLKVKTEPVPNHISNRKRALENVTPRPTKKSCLAKNAKPNNEPERTFKKRPLTTLLDELILRVENNDRQLTNHLLRELDSEHVRSLTGDEVLECCKNLLNACVSAKMDTVAQKVMRTLVAVLSRATPNQYFEFLSDMKETETCERLFAKSTLDVNIVEIYERALRNGYILPNDVPQLILTTARRGLSQVDGCSTIKSLEFMVSYALADRINTAGLNSVEKYLCDLAKDRDVRTRQIAARGILKLSSKGVHLSKTTYFVAKELLQDCDSKTRIISLQLLLHFASRKPAETTGEEGTLSITDDAFSSVCDAMNDIDISVRVKAAKILGDFEDVTQELIFQTLDKKMMASNKQSAVVKIEKSMFSISKKSNNAGNKRWKFLKNQEKNEPAERSRGGWSRGKELNASCPTAKDEKEEEEEDSIIPHGACGAFVSALEDEFMDVRKAAVFSLGRLAMNRPAFAVSAFEYLADMFNDEIAEVRLDSINALTPLIAHGQINNEQLSVILKCLDDAMPESRQAMRELLKRAQFVDVQCIDLCVKALLACLKRFPKDKENIFSCLGVIGANHSVYVQSMMRSLLGLHLYFHTREVSIEDLSYLAKLIVVLNAASKQQQMVYVMPEFVQRHYRFLRSTSPHLVLPIAILDEQQNGRLKKTAEQETSGNAESILENIYRKLCAADKAQDQMAGRLREEIFRDSDAVSSYNENVSGAARLICCISEIQSSISAVSPRVSNGEDIFDIRGLISQQLDYIFSVEHQFSGFSTDIQIYFAHCRLYLGLLDLASWLMRSIIPQQQILKTAASLIASAQSYLKKCSASLNSARFSEFLTACESTFSKVASGQDLKKIITPNTVRTLISSFEPHVPEKFLACQSIKLKYAQITTPNKDAALESTIKFCSNMPHGIAFEANIFNITKIDVESIRVKVIFPDGKNDIMKPRENEIRKVDGMYTLSTSVKITSSSPWSDSAEIELVIGFLTASNAFVTMLESPFCFTQANVRVRIHPVAR